MDYPRDGLSLGWLILGMNKCRNELSYGINFPRDWKSFQDWDEFSWGESIWGWFILKSSLPWQSRELNIWIYLKTVILMTRQQKFWNSKGILRRSISSKGFSNNLLMFNRSTSHAYERVLKRLNSVITHFRNHTYFFSRALQKWSICIIDRSLYR